MAGVEARAGVLAVEVVGPPRHELGDVRECAVGLGLDREHDLRAARGAPLAQRRHDVPDVGGGQRQAGIVVRDPAPVGQRARRDRAELAVRQQPREDLREAQRVGDPLRRAPVGRVDVGLDALTVKRPVGEAVDREDVEPLGVQPLAQALELVAVEQLLALDAGDAQSEAERRIRRDPGLQRGCMCAKALRHGRPPVGGVDVRAVRQMQVLADPHRTATTPSRSGSANFGDCERNSIGFS